MVVMDNSIGRDCQDRACVQVEGIRRNDLPAVRGPASVRLSLAVASLSAYALHIFKSTKNRRSHLHHPCYG